MEEVFVIIFYYIANKNYNKNVVKTCQHVILFIGHKNNAKRIKFVYPKKKIFFLNRNCICDLFMVFYLG